MSDDIVDAKTIAITFSDGSVRRFAFEPMGVEPSVLASKVQGFFAQGYINLQMDDRFLMIPMGNVQSIEITPRPAGELPNTFRVLHEFGT